MFKKFNFDEKYYDQNEINDISFSNLVNSKEYIIIKNDTVSLSASRFVNRMPTTNPSNRKISRHVKLGLKQNSIDSNRYFKYLWILQDDKILMEQRLDNDKYFYLSEEINLSKKLKLIVLLRADSTTYLLRRNDIKINPVY